MNIKSLEFADDLADPNHSLTSAHVSNSVIEQIQFEKRLSFLLRNVSFLLLVLMMLVIPLMFMIEQKTCFFC